MVIKLPLDSIVRSISFLVYLASNWFQTHLGTTHHRENVAPCFDTLVTLFHDRENLLPMVFVGTYRYGARVCANFLCSGAGSGGNLDTGVE